MILLVICWTISLQLFSGFTDIFFIADCGDYVVVLNAKDILVSGKKAEQKLYRHHTMHPGGLKEITFENLQAKDATEVKEDEMILMIRYWHLEKFFL